MIGVTSCFTAYLSRLQVIFIEPYIDAANNHWTSPQLDKDVAVLRSNPRLRSSVLRMCDKFNQNAEALLHGDLHTGSIMVTPTSTSVIDPEFAFYGPMAFDIAKILANLFLAYFALPGKLQGVLPGLLSPVDHVQQRGMHRERLCSTSACIMKYARLISSQSFCKGLYIDRLYILTPPSFSNN